jgi:phosphatidylglycerophosphatase A
MNSPENNKDGENNTSQIESSSNEYMPQAAPLLTEKNTARSSPSRASARFLFSSPVHFISLGAGSGLSPFAPGTVGTLYAWLSFLVLDHYLNDLQWGLLISLGFVAGLWLTARTARALNTSDPSAVVWDEIIAFWLVLWLVMPASFLTQFIAFALFRFFDAVKPGPVGWADRKFSGGMGIMLDDLIAAGCTLVTMTVWMRLFA